MQQHQILALCAAIRGRGLQSSRENRIFVPPALLLDDSEKGRTWADGKNCLDEMAHSYAPGCLHHFTGAVTAEEVYAALATLTPGPIWAPQIIVVESLGIFVLARDRNQARGALATLYGTPPRSATETTQSGGRLDGHVAVVTGSAQGFGKGIAEELAAEGAAVVIADINREAGSRFAEELCRRHDRECAVFQPTDVTSLESIDECVLTAATFFGGIDLFVSNAGVLKAGSLDEMEVEAFDLVTRVNYRAFFLCAKSVARLMKLQHRFCPDHSMDIVQVNSKSGLAGSNKNFAYAGGKFGGIGLTQSFALELVEHRIKVNAVCPGNYYEGPLWSDPHKGLFVQYLAAGKVPGATTIDDIKQFYMNKVPMRRGCSPLDVTRAILYAHDQEYETGQAIPVTGGQIMLK